MEDFAWLTPDRLVQKTIFGGAVEMITNFRAEPFRYGQIQIPAQAIAARHLDTGSVEIFK